jgi:hypothetical protein
MLKAPLCGFLIVVLFICFLINLFYIFHVFFSVSKSIVVKGGKFVCIKSIP